MEDNRAEVRHERIQAEMIAMIASPRAVRVGTSRRRHCCRRLGISARFAAETRGPKSWHRCCRAYGSSASPQRAHMAVTQLEDASRFIGTHPSDRLSLVAAFAPHATSVTFGGGTKRNHGAALHFPARRVLRSMIARRTKKGKRGVIFIHPLIVAWRALCNGFVQARLALGSLF